MSSLDADADVVRAVQAGSTEAFGELFRRHYSSVQRACFRRLRDTDDADEVAQATFVRALERIDQCEGERRFGPWVQVIARRICLDTVRARARTQPEGDPVGEDQAGVRGRNATVSLGAGNPEESVLHQEAVRHMQDALQTLSSRQREAVVARAVEERPPSEIAATLGLSTGAVDSLLMRARRRLALAYRRKAG